MDTFWLFWPLIMVAALVAVGFVMKKKANERRRRKKGLKQHPRPKQVS